MGKEKEKKRKEKNLLVCQLLLIVGLIRAHTGALLVPQPCDRTSKSKKLLCASTVLYYTMQYNKIYMVCEKLSDE